METIVAADGHKVPSTFVSNGSNKLVILSHGITTGRDEEGAYTGFVDKFLFPTFDSIRFDFRGHGESAVPPSEVTVAGEILDLMAVVGWARKHKYAKLFHVGTSFGASITLLSVARFSFKDFARVAFWNPVINYQNTFVNATVEWGREFFNQKSLDELAYRAGTPIPETNFVIGPRMTIELMLYRPQDTVWPARLPLLVIHGDRDTAVPYVDAVAYCERNRKVATLHTMRDVDHGFDSKINEAYKLTLKWFTKAA